MPNPNIDLPTRKVQGQNRQHILHADPAEQPQESALGLIHPFGMLKFDWLAMSHRPLSLLPLAFSRGHLTKISCAQPLWYMSQVRLHSRRRKRCGTKRQGSTSGACIWPALFMQLGNGKSHGPADSPIQFVSQHTNPRRQAKSRAVMRSQ